MNSLQSEWEMTGGDKEDLQQMNPLQMLLNAPLSGYTTHLEADGRPFVSHKFEDTPHFASLLVKKTTYAEKISSVTSTWGEFSPAQTDWNKLASLTEGLIKAALSFDSQKVQEFIQSGADPNTLVLVKNRLSSAGEYIPAPLGVAVVLYAESLGKEHIVTARETAQCLLTKSDGTSKIQVGAYKDSMALSYPVVGIEWGSDAINRQLPLSLAQSNAFGKCLPGVFSDVRAPDNKIAYGEDLPKLSRESYVDMYEPVRDTLTEALRQYRSNRLAGSSPKPSGPKV